MRKNCSKDREKLLKFEAEGQEFAKNFEITGTVHWCRPDPKKISGRLHKLDNSGCRLTGRNSANKIKFLTRWYKFSWDNKVTLYTESQRG